MWVFNSRASTQAVKGTRLGRPEESRSSPVWGQACRRYPFANVHAMKGSSGSFRSLRKSAIIFDSRSACRGRSSALALASPCNQRIPRIGLDVSRSIERPAWLDERRPRKAWRLLPKLNRRTTNGTRYQPDGDFASAAVNFSANVSPDDAGVVMTEQGLGVAGQMQRMPSQVPSVVLRMHHDDARIAFGSSGMKPRPFMFDWPVSKKRSK